MRIAAVPVRGLVLALAAAVAAGSCAPRPVWRGTGSESENRPVAVHVDNRSGFSLRVYVVSETSQKQRLGTMGSYETARFTVPSEVAAVSSEVQMLAEPTGTSRVFTSQPVLISPGDFIEWRILNDRGRSTVTVRSGGGDTTSVDG